MLESGLLQTILCGLDRWVDVGYISMTVACVITALGPCSQLQTLVASHGKTRPSTTQEERRIQATDHWHWSSLLLRLWRRTVPKQWFGHFYVYGLIFLTLTLRLALHQPPECRGAGSTIAPSTTTTLLLLYLHLGRRWYECYYIHQWRSTSAMHWLGYVVGVLHYVWLPLVFVRLPLSSSECAGGGCEATTWLAVVLQNIAPFYYHHHNNNDDTSRKATSMLKLSPPSRAAPWLYSLWCLWAQFQQHRHHVLLAELRNVKVDDKNHKSNNTYSLPTGGWFPYIVCPHYLAEIMIYVSFALLLSHEQQHARRPWIVVVWVVTNLTVSARLNLQWYRTHLSHDVMAGRTALVPFVW